MAFLILKSLLVKTIEEVKPNQCTQKGGEKYMQSPKVAVRSSKKLDVMNENK